MSCNTSIALRIPYLQAPVRASSSRFTSHLQKSSDQEWFYVYRINNKLRIAPAEHVRFQKVHGEYVINYNIEGYCISVVEDNYDEMVEEFKSELQDAWEYFALEKDKNLSFGARKVKAWLLQHVYEG